MKHLLLVALLAMTVGVSFGKVEPYKGSRIFWDMSSKTTIFPSGTYSRMIQLQDGRLLAVAEGGGVKISFSQDKGKSWSGARVIEENPDKMNYAVPDLIQLSDGTILVGFNPRPQEPYSEDRKFGIRVLRSTDNGETWGKVTEKSNLKTPICMSSVDVCGNTLYLTFPDDYYTRANLTVAYSEDGGETFEKKVLYDGPGGYSCVTSGGNGKVFVIAEVGKVNYNEALVFFRIDIMR